MADQAAIFDAVERHRQAVEDRDREALGRMIRAYARVYDRVQSRIERIQEQIAEAEAAGDTVSPSWLFQEQRLQLLGRLVEREVGRFVRFAGGAIEDEQRYFAALGEEHTRELALLGLDPAPRGVTVAFSYLPKTAIESQVGFLGDGSPLSSLLDELGPAASRQVRDALIQAVATGLGPRETARMIRSALGGNLSRALTIARTEQLRSLREASYQSAQANADIMRGWIWNAHLGPRTCAACIALHGTVHPVTERIAEHPNGRCTQVWITKTWDEILGRKTGIRETRVDPDSVEKGPDWFDRQDAGFQRDVLGPAKYRAFQAQVITIQDLVGTRESEQWGTMHFERSLRDVLGADQARKFYGGSVASGGGSSSEQRQGPSQSDSSASPQKAPISARRLESIVRRKEREIRNNPTESAWAYDAAGSLVVSKGGNANSVGFSASELRVLQGTVLTHNHPAFDVTLSSTDVVTAVTHGVVEIRAVTDHSTYSLRLTDPRLDVQYLRSTLLPTWDGHIRSLAARYLPEYRAGRMSEQEFEETVQNEALLRTARDLDLDYRYRRHGGRWRTP